MLQHEQTDPPPISPTVPLLVSSAAEARVTPDELIAALKTLENQQSGTVAIGLVVDELRLNATPEQIWEQVQRQRGQAVVKEPAGVVNAKAGQRPRSWHKVKGLMWTIFWITIGVVCVTSSSKYYSRASGNTLIINGDYYTDTILAQGKDIINGDHDNITLRGQAHYLAVSGAFATLHGDAPKTYDLSGNTNHAEWTGNEPHPVAPRPPSP